MTLRITSCGTFLLLVQVQQVVSEKNKQNVEKARSVSDTHGSTLPKSVRTLTVIDKACLLNLHHSRKQSVLSKEIEINKESG